VYGESKVSIRLRAGQVIFAGDHGILFPVGTDKGLAMAQHPEALKHLRFTPSKVCVFFFSFFLYLIIILIFLAHRIP